MEKYKEIQYRRQCWRFLSLLWTQMRSNGSFTTQNNIRKSRNDMKKIIFSLISITRIFRTEVYNIIQYHAEPLAYI